MSTTTTETHDALHIPANNLLDGRAYETYPAFLRVAELREGDVITDGVGVYQVNGVGNYWSDVMTPSYVRHIRISHTIAGPIMGGLLRGEQETIHVLARRRSP